MYESLGVWEWFGLIVSHIVAVGAGLFGSAFYMIWRDDE